MIDTAGRVIKMNDSILPVYISQRCWRGLRRTLIIDDRKVKVMPFDIYKSISGGGNTPIVTIECSIYSCFGLILWYNKNYKNTQVSEMRK